MTSGAADEPESDMQAGFHEWDVPETRFRTLKCHSEYHGALLQTFPQGDAERRIRTFQAGEFSQRVDAPIAQFCSLGGRPESRTARAVSRS